MQLPLGWHTDLAVLALTGATIEDHGDHLVARSAQSPDYYWGNLVYAGAVLDDPAGWLARFEELFPTAPHRSIGLADQPPDPTAWTALGLVLESADVLASTQLPAGRPLPAGYEVRALEADADWAASVVLRQTTFADHTAFAEQTTESRKRMVQAGHTRWIGAFAPDGALASELGIVDLGDGLARYQSVVTGAEHRRRGLTSHLVGVAAAWAWERSCRTLVILADTGSDAGRLYQSLGFEHRTTSWQAGRTP